MHLLRTIMLSAALVGSAASARADAQLGLLEGRAQLQIQLGLLDYANVRSTPGSSFRDDDPTFSSKNTQYGLSSRVGVGLGYGVSEQVQLGLFAGFAKHTSSSTRPTDGEQGGRVRASTVQLIPSIRYVAGEGAQRFYVGAAAGFERTKNSGGAYTTSTHGLLGGQLGVYYFVQQQVSLDPALELYWVKGQSTPSRPADSDVEGSDTDSGVRLLLTLGLSLWSQAMSHEAPVAAAPAAQEWFAPEPQLPLDEVQYVATRVDDVGLRLLGSPRRSGIEFTVGLTAHSPDDPPSCQVNLISDRPPLELHFDWALDGADQEGPLQSGSARTNVALFEQWLTHTPNLSVCGRQYPLGEDVIAELAAGLARFRDEVRTAGTVTP